jgi:hypothetical protein
MSRPPNTGPRERERQGLIRRYTALLRELERVPAHRREDEVADVRADICRRLLAELGAPGYALRPGASATVEVVDIDALIAEIDRK